MEWSALVYVFLTVMTIGLALCIDNREYVAAAISGRRLPGQYTGYERRRARNLVAEFAICALLTGVSACRIAVGNDYWVYRENFKLIAQERDVASEFGFNLIVRGMYDLFGYDKYLPVFGLFSILTVFFFVKALHDQGKYYAFSLFLLLTGGYYFLSMNSVRYYLALAMALFAQKYVLRGEYGKFVLWIILAAMFHKSVLLVIPVYLVARFLAATKLKPWHYAVGGVFLLSLVFGQELYRELIFLFYPGYRGTELDIARISLTNIAKCVGTLGVCALAYKYSMKEDLVNRFYAVLNLMGLVVHCCGSFIPEVSRIGYYMLVSQIFLLPNLIGAMPKGWLKTLCKVGVMAAFSVYFVLLLRDMYAVDVRVLPYLNWIFN